MDYSSPSPNLNHTPDDANSRIHHPPPSTLALAPTLNTRLSRPPRWRRLLEAKLAWERVTPTLGLTIILTAKPSPNPYPYPHAYRNPHPYACSCPYPYPYAHPSPNPNPYPYSYITLTRTLVLSVNLSLTLTVARPNALLHRHPMHPCNSEPLYSSCRS